MLFQRAAISSFAYSQVVVDMFNYNTDDCFLPLALFNRPPPLPGFPESLVAESNHKLSPGKSLQLQSSYFGWDPASTVERCMHSYTWCKHMQIDHILMLLNLHNRLPLSPAPLSYPFSLKGLFTPSILPNFCLSLHLFILPMCSSQGHIILWNITSNLGLTHSTVVGSCSFIKPRLLLFNEIFVKEGIRIT